MSKWLVFRKTNSYSRHPMSDFRSVLAIFLEERGKAVLSRPFLSPCSVYSTRVTSGGHLYDSARKAWSLCFQIFSKLMQKNYLAIPLTEANQYGRTNVILGRILAVSAFGLQLRSPPALQVSPSASFV